MKLKGVSPSRIFVGQDEAEDILMVFFFEAMEMKGEEDL